MWHTLMVINNYVSLFYFDTQCSKVHTDSTGFGLMRSHAASNTTRTNRHTCRMSMNQLGKYKKKFIQLARCCVIAIANYYRKIDLRYAKVTPGIAGGTSGSHTFLIGYTIICAY